MNCPLCSEKPAGEFWRGRHFYAIDAGNEDFPAYIRIVACDHVAEMSMLSPALKTELRALLDAAEDEMIAALAPGMSLGTASTPGCRRDFSEAPRRSFGTAPQACQALF